MKAFKYEIEVSEGALEATHGMKIRIFEYYIPSEGLYFNQTGAVFKDDSSRFVWASSVLPFIEKDISDKLVGLLVHFLKIKLELESLMISFF